MQTTAEQKEPVHRSLALVAPTAGVADTADTAAPVAVPSADGAPGSALRPPGDTPLARALARGAAPV